MFVYSLPPIDFFTGLHDLKDIKNENLREIDS